MAQHIHTGRWTDWSEGQIMGDKITLSNGDANILIAFIAVLNTFIGAVFWKASAYCLHQALASDAPYDGLHHQHQVLLRASESSASFILKLFSNSWSWRKHVPTKSLLIRVSLLALPAVLVFTGFTVMSIFLSKIATTGSVLLRSSSCGTLQNSPLFGTDAREILSASTALMNDLNRGFDMCFTYAENCYGISRKTSTISSYDFSLPASGSDCNFFPQPSLNWTTISPVDCPFQEGKCAVPNSEIVQFDTGYISSHDHLGVNAAEADRVEFRQVMTCSPIVTEEYMTSTISNESLPEKDRVANYYFVEDEIAPTFSYQFRSKVAHDSPYIFSVASDRAKRPFDFTQYTFKDSLVKTSHEEASVALYFLANQAVFVGNPTEDPWFNATLKVGTVQAPSPIDVYASNTAGNVVGCTTTREMCNPAVSPRTCMPANNLPLVAITYDWSDIGLNKIQAATADEITITLDVGGTPHIASSLGLKGLSATEYLLGYPKSGQASMPLPENQWQIEMERLQATTMSVLQSGIWAYLTVFNGDPDLIPYFRRDNLTDLQSSMCKNQKVNHKGYTSFTVVNLALIFTLDILVIFLCATITIVVPMIQKRFHSGEYKRRAWAANNPVQMQRGLYQAVGNGDWEGSMYDTPITKCQQTFAGFHDIENLEKTIKDRYALVKEDKDMSSTELAFPHNNKQCQII